LKVIEDTVTTKRMHQPTHAIITFNLFLLIVTFAAGTNIRTGRVVFTKFTNSPTNCIPNVIATLTQSLPDTTTLTVNLQISGITASCGLTNAPHNGHFTLDIFQYGHNIHSEEQKNIFSPSQKATASYHFGTLFANVWNDASNTLSYDISLNGVSLQLGQESSVLGRSMALRYCASTGSCDSILASGVIGKALPLSSSDTNVAGPSSSVESGDASLYCSLQGLRNDLSGSVLFSNELDTNNNKGAAIHLTATGSNLISGNTHRLSLHPYGGSDEDQHVVPLNVVGSNEPLKQ
jgi:hypothetical protein